MGNQICNYRRSMGKIIWATLIDTKLCSFCIQEAETILHNVWSCLKVQDLVSSFKNHCEKNYLNFTMDGGSFILGYMLQLPNGHDFVFMCIKLYIYRKRCLQETMHLQGLLSNIKTQLITWNTSIPKWDILTTIHKDRENCFFSLDKLLLKPWQLHSN